ncbi:MAG: RIO1 family regulatory kinase/ATPase [Caldilineaceae bacterium]
MDEKSQTTEQQQSTTEPAADFDLQESINRLRAHFQNGANPAQNSAQQSDNQQDTMNIQNNLNGSVRLNGALLNNDAVDDDVAIEEQYLTQFGLDDGEFRQARRKKKANHRPKKSADQIRSELAETAELETQFKTTYTPARFEEGWLRDSLQPFYQQGLITDVLMLVKGGKEANVYLCRAHPSTELEYMAAKVYRPRAMRNLRNDITYREGREILNSADGGVVRRRESRQLRAIRKKTAFGVELLHGSWLGYEYQTLGRLSGMGARVPKPVAQGENAMLMHYVGDESVAAPVLHSVTLPREEVQPLFNEVMRNVELMLKNELIHGDLSAYNILYWQGQVTLIDFPQVTAAIKNRNAYKIFERDVQRVCDYFNQQGMDVVAPAFAATMWRHCLGLEPGQQLWDE